MTEQDLSKLQSTIEKQSENITKLLIVCDVLSKTVSKHEQWITDHQDNYQQLRERMLSTEMTGKIIADKFDHMTNTMETVMTSYLADRNKVKGGWWVLAGIVTFSTSVLALVIALLH